MRWDEANCTKKSHIKCLTIGANKARFMYISESKIGWYLILQQCSVQCSVQSMLLFYGSRNLLLFGFFLLSIDIHTNCTSPVNDDLLWEWSPVQRYSGITKQKHSTYRRIRLECNHKRRYSSKCRLKQEDTLIYSQGCWKGEWMIYLFTWSIS